MAADRFAPQSDEKLQALLEAGDSSNKKKNVHVIGTAKRILLEYCGVKHIEVDGLLIKSKEEILFNIELTFQSIS